MGFLKRKKLIIFIPNLGRGGAEKVASILSFNLKKYKKKLLLIDDVVERKYGCKLEIINTKKYKSGFLKKIIYWHSILQKIRELKATLGNDIFISFMPKQNIINAMTKRSEICVLSIRNYESKDLEGKLFFIYKYLIKKYYANANAIVSVSKSAAEDLNTVFGVPKNLIHVIYNPIDVNYIKQKQQERIEVFESIFKFKTIVSVGNPRKAKGYVYLIRIFKKLVMRNKGLKLVIIGSSPEFLNYISFSRKLNLKTFSIEEDKEVTLDNQVYFLGKQENPYKYIFNATIYALPSLWEGFPNVLLEAIACGTPVISSDCPSGPRELLAPNTNYHDVASTPEKTLYGMLMPPFMKNKNDIIDQLNKSEWNWVYTLDDMLNNNELVHEFARYNTRRIEDFSIDNIMIQWDTLLDSLKNEGI